MSENAPADPHPCPGFPCNPGCEEDGCYRRQRPGAQAASEPVFWYRPCSDGGYEGPLPHSSIEDVRKRSGAWVPLYATPAGERPAQAEPGGLPTMKHGYSLVRGEKGHIAFHDDQAKAAWIRAVESGTFNDPIERVIARFAAILASPSARERPGAQAPSTAACDGGQCGAGGYCKECLLAAPSTGGAKTAALYGFDRENLEAVAEGLAIGYEASINVGNVTGEGDDHLESTTAYAARFIRTVLASSAPASSTGGAETAEPVGYVPYCHTDGKHCVQGEFRMDEFSERPFAGGMSDPAHWECRAVYIANAAAQSPAASPASKEDGSQAQSQPIAWRTRITWVDPAKGAPGKWVYTEREDSARAALEHNSSPTRDDDLKYEVEALIAVPHGLSVLGAAPSAGQTLPASENTNAG